MIDPKLAWTIIISVLATLIGLFVVSTYSILLAAYLSVTITILSVCLLVVEE